MRSARWGLAWASALMVCAACNDGGPAIGGGEESSSTGGTSVTASTGSPDSTGGGHDGPATGEGTSSSGVDSTGIGTGDAESGTTGIEPGTFEACFAGQFVNELPQADYDQYEPVLGSHCVGTNHQDIADIERVVFLGDSITVGSRPTTPSQSYRAVLADLLRDQYGLAYGDGTSEFLWKAPDPFSGEAATMTSGDFTSCSRWGARNDDLPPGVGNQIEDCFPEETRELRTLVVITSGGNDVSSLAQDAIAGVPYDELLVAAEEVVALKREAVEWIVAPGQFPNGVYVVFANIYEFTDGTADVMSCPAAGAAGFDQPVPNPEELTALILWLNEQYLSIAVDTQTDMLFLLETFCGHGFHNDNPKAPCYRGPDTPRWFDATCIHPNPTGHGEIANNFMSIVTE